MKTEVTVSILLLLALPAAVMAQGRQAARPSSCEACHAELDEEFAAAWSRDVHDQAGLGCTSCHGGDPSPDLAEDLEAAMSPEAGFEPPPDRLDIPEFCARCHSDAGFMKRYNPQARVDQLVEYRTSVHGKLNAEGDPVPAVCTDCHGVHGIRPVSAPDSSVHATNVPEMCARCHGDAATMEPYGIPTGQYEEYLESAHAAALFEREDTSAPACNDCHGNHGATPPGVASVANVCGHCHGRQSALFRESFKVDLFAEMGVAECIVCHGNHRIIHPTPELFKSSSRPRTTQGRIVATEPFAATLGDIEPGQQVDLSWVVVLDPHRDGGDGRLDQNVRVIGDGIDPLELDATVLPGFVAGEEEPRRASSVILSAALTFEPLSGSPVQPGDAVRLLLAVEASGSEPVSAVRVETGSADGVIGMAGPACLTCHEPGDQCDRATERMGEALSSLEREVRDAENLLHRAEVVGMEVSEARFDLANLGISAVVDSRTLIHSFDPERLIGRTEEGREAARAAREAAEAALGEHQVRRRGLAASMILIVLVLVGLFFKIREVDRARA